MLHKEFQQLCESLKFSQEQINTLTDENKSLQHFITSLTAQFGAVAKENKDMKETILDLQSRSMRDNLVFSGIPEPTHDNNPEGIHDHAPQNLPGHSKGHYILLNTANKRPRPIVAKFEHLKQKQQGQRHGRQLKGTDYGLNNQFPRDSLDRRKILHPIRKQNMQEGKKRHFSR